MKKSKSIVIFCITMVVIILLGCIDLFGVGSQHKGKTSHINLGLDLEGGVSVSFEIQEEDFTSTEFDDTVNKLKQRVYSDFSTEADVYTEGGNRIVVDIPGETNLEEVKDELGKPGSLKFVTYSSTDETSTDASAQEEIVWLEGTDIKDATPGYQKKDDNTETTDYVVSLTFTEEGREKFKEATAANVGQILYIIYDDKLISYPTVSKEIDSDTAQIEGLGSYETAEDLASNIRIGSLKLTLEEVSSKVVSAKLGDNSVKTSLIAGMIGVLIIIIFMIVMYRVPGVAASLALISYVVMMLLILNAFDMTLTLSGIAGIILSIGMAVDANVIIFARLKEEVASGKSVQNAMKDGFKKATSAIVDGNITTFIVAIVLMILGSGSVQGFAQTLAIGIVLSMFTCMLVSRLFINAFYGMGIKDVKFYGKQKERKPIDFVGKKPIFFIISLVVIVAGVITMMVTNVTQGKALNFTVEFIGGTSTTVEFEKDYTIDEFNNDIKPALAEVIGDDDIQGQKVDDGTAFVIKTKDLSEETKEEYYNTLVEEFGAKEDSISRDSISQSISSEQKREAVIAVLVATVFMLLYIWFRFKNIKFASSAVIALIHDVAILVAFYAMARTAVGNSFIACMLTIIGYSINATIVIFDRIRENLPIMQGQDLKNIVNTSITQTLTRSIYTSFTTFVMVLLLYILGVPAIREFALPLMVGIIAGGYSSVCITGALFYVMSKKKYNKNLKKN